MNELVPRKFASKDGRAITRLSREPPADLVPRVAKCAARGLGIQGMAKEFSVERDTFLRWLQQFPQALAVVEAVQEIVPVLRGRPTKKPPADAAERIKRYASECPILKTVAAEFETTPAVLNVWMRENEDLRDAYEIGKAKDLRKQVIGLREDAEEREKPNINRIAYLKLVHGMREGDASDSPARVNITFNLPGAMSRDDFMKTVVQNVSSNE